MYVFLDYLFVTFHGLWVLFNLLGWAWRKTRPWQLVTSGLTIASWFGLGLFYGFGYCPCTDWHWQVKRKLGAADLPASYVKYYADHLTGLDWQTTVVDVVTVAVGVGVFLLSCCLNWRDWRRAKRLDAV
ncbi:MAG: DUF2784 domain-containing protein [Pirellulales bacterium]